MTRSILWTLAAALSLSALADNLGVGDWRGSGGRIFRISTSSGPFSLVVVETQGERKSFPAVWEKPGEKFTWTDAQHNKHVVCLEKEHKPIRFRDVGEAYPDSPGYWYFVTR